MSLYYDENAPTTLPDIASTLNDYAHSIVVDLHSLYYAVEDKKSEDEARLWTGLDDKAESLEYLADKLQEISHAFTVINKTVYNPSGE